MSSHYLYYFLRNSGANFPSFCILTFTISAGVPTNPPAAPEALAKAIKVTNPGAGPLDFSIACLATSYTPNRVVE